MPNQLTSIKHVVQLMLENRSFDQMLGFLYADNGNRSPLGQPFDGLTGDESNPDRAGRRVPVFKIDSQHPHPYFRPGADPGEGYYNTNIQLFATENPPDGMAATNSGFVINFENAIAYDQSRHYKDSLPDTKPSDIMGMYTSELVPIMSGLARGFAVCDRWFASVPTQTIPNRAFAAAATSQGRLDNHVKNFSCPSIFGRLSDKGLDWAIFGYHREPLTRLDFADTRQADESHFGHFSDFQARAAAGTLPAYTFLEPDFSSGGNSQHPNYDVALGEALIHDVYYTLRNGPGWNETLLLITFDEHGGNYDHVPPPTGAVSPDGLAGEFDNFDFTRFGVRIPALLISPRIASGTVFRASTGTIDHTSVLKTLEERWGLEPLTERDKAAPSLGDVLTLAQPRTDDPLSGVDVPSSGAIHPNQQQPSELDRIYARRVSLLPVPNDHGTFSHTPPDLSTSDAIGDYIRARTAAWKQHRGHRRSMPLPASPNTAVAGEYWLKSPRARISSSRGSVAGPRPEEGRTGREVRAKAGHHQGRRAATFRRQLARPATSLADGRDGLDVSRQSDAPRLDCQSDRRAACGGRRCGDRVVGLLPGRRAADIADLADRDTLAVALTSCKPETVAWMRASAAPGVGVADGRRPMVGLSIDGERNEMAIGRTVLFAALLGLGVVPLTHAQSSKPLFIAADMVRGPGGSGPGCVLSNRFMRKEEVAWSIRVQDATGKELDDKSLKSLVVELSDGQQFQAHFGGHPPKAPADLYWSTAWTIPADHPTGSFNYKVIATAEDGSTQTWQPFNTKPSLLTVIDGTFEPPAK